MNKFRKGIAALFLSIFGLSQMIYPVCAKQVSEPVTSSALDANWPAGPSVNSTTAILIEAETGTVLYDKNMHQQMYPASITKILTTLIATEQCQLNEDVTFTSEMLQTIPYDSSRIWVDSGEYMSMESCLAAILIVSANDVAAGVAEHIAGDLDSFADIMNERAKELGCLNSHFVNAHGYHDTEHYTTAYDMAQIARAFFENDLLSSLAKERSFKVEPTAGQPDSIWESNKNQLLETRSYEYEYLVGSKTGYTSAAGQTLVSCAQKDGMKLICVVMNAQSPDQYKDTVTLFDFGFSNFTTANIYDNDTTYVSAHSSYGIDVIDVLGDSSPLLNMDKTSVIVLPKTASFSDTTSYVKMAQNDESYMATVHYQYGTYEIGASRIYITAHSGSLKHDYGELTSTETTVSENTSADAESLVYINVKGILFYVLPAVAGVLLFIFICRQVMAYRHEKNPSLSKRRMSHRFLGLRKFFISFVRSLQAIIHNFKSIIRFNAVRSRYKRRGSATSWDYTSVDSNTSRRKYQQVDYNLKASSNRKEHNRKNITFHDINK